MKIGLIGASQIGGAMIKGWTNNNHFQRTDLIVKGGQSDTARKLQRKIGFTLVEDLKSFEQVRLLVVATPAASVLSILDSLPNSFKQKQIPIVSLASSISLKEMQKVLGPEYPLTHCIPNTPVQVNQRVMGIVYAESLLTSQKNKDHR